MAEFRFLHAADLHLDSPLRGLEADPSAPVELIRGATRRTLGRLVDLALDEQVAFLIIAGDIYDGDWPDYGTGLFFAAQMRRLTDAGVRVFAVRGNHDAHNRMTRALRMPHVTMFDHAAPETVMLPELGVALHGQSFAEQAVVGDLSLGYPAPLPGMFNIGVLHTSASGYAAHERYAPCEVPRLRTHGYDYWALGHVHQREVLADDPWIVFPGNIQGRHIGETGPKGATLVSVAEGRVVSVEPRVLDVLRWAHLEVDIDGAADEPEALGRVNAALDAALREASRPLAARLTLRGATAAHAALEAEGLREKILNEAHHVGGTDLLWLEAVRLRTRPAAGLLHDRPDQLGRLLAEVATLAEHPPEALLGDWPAAMLGKLRDALPGEHPLFACADGDRTAILEQARLFLDASLTAMVMGDAG